MNPLHALSGQRREYFSNTIWIMAEKVVGLLLTMIATVLVAKHLGPNDFGALSYTLSTISLFAVIGHLGLSGLVIRELVKQPVLESQILGTVFVIKAVGYLVCYFLILALTLALVSDPTEVILFAILGSALIFKPFEAIDFWFSSALKAKYPTVARTTSVVIATAFKLILIAMGAGVIYISVAYVLESAIAAILLILLFNKKSSHSIATWNFSLDRARNLLKESWLVFLGTLFSLIYLKIDQVMLKWMSGNESVGTYALAAKLSEGWYFVPAAIVASVYPRLIRLRETDEALYRRRLQQLLDFLFALALTVSLATSVLATPLLTWIAGPSFTASADVLVVHIWAGVFIFMRAAFSKWILIEGALVFSTVTQGMGAVLNIGLNLLLIPEYGGLGAAWATLISYAAASYFSLFLHAKTRPFANMMTLSIISPIRYSLLIGKYALTHAKAS